MRGRQEWRVVRGSRRRCAAPHHEGRGSPVSSPVAAATIPHGEERPQGASRTANHGQPFSPHPSIFSAAMNASCGISTLPNCRIFFLPAFCFSSSLRLRETSPP